MELKKTFDTVKMVREIRNAHYEATKSMTLSEKLAFYRAKSKRLREERGLPSDKKKPE